MNDPEPGAQPPLPSSDHEFLKEFQQVIESYAGAVEAGKTEDADRAAMTALMMAGMEAMKNPSPDLLLSQEADRYENEGDWAGAETTYLKLLHMQEQTGNFGLVAKPQLDLSRLCLHVGKVEEAWSYACAATASARRTDVYPLVVMALQNEAACALRRGDNDRALAAASEAVRVIPPGRIADLMRSRALTTRAQCRLANGDVQAAKEDLKASWEIIGTRDLSSFATGPVVALSNWWEVQAEVHSREGALTEAVTALNRAIEERRKGREKSGCPSPYTRAALADLLEKLAALSRRVADSDGAQQALAEASTIRKEIHLPPDPAARADAASGAGI